jgi:P4 family phage/plasmid primase-like protien
MTIASAFEPIEPRNPQSPQPTADPPTTLPATFLECRLAANDSPKTEADPHDEGHPAGFQCTTLLSCLWRSADRVHQLTIKDARGTFRNVAVNGVPGAVLFAFNESAAARDLYFACAEFETADTRTAANAHCAWALWLDIDCGADKAASGKGYASPEQAEAALTDFCTAAQLPEPTHVVNSGAGLHVYWCVDRAIVRLDWVNHAKRLKSLAAALGLLADPARTADMASVLRVPGTLNHKYAPPRPVELEQSRPALPCGALLERICSAHERFCTAVTTGEKEAPDRAPSGQSGLPSQAPDLARLASALRVLDPDCDDSTWKLRRLAPMAREARAFPDLADGLRALARTWSSGELRGLPACKWQTSTTQGGPCGADIFATTWNRFLTETFDGAPTTLGTIYHDATLAGWSAALPVVPATTQAAATKPVHARDSSTLDALVAQLKAGDIGAPLEPQHVTAMATLQRESPAQYTRFRQQLKDVNGKVPLAAVDSAVRQAQRELGTPATHHGYANDILAQLTVDGWPPVTHEGLLFVLDPITKIWVGRDLDFITKLVANSHDGSDNCKRMTDYKGVAQHAMTLASDDSFFEKAPLGVACPDGFIQIAGDTVTVEAIAPEHRQRVLMSDSPRVGPMPRFEGFLHETFASKEVGEEEQQVRLVKELAGAILLGIAPRYQKAFLFYDPFGRAGKGTLMDILRQLVPPQFRSAVSPFQWGQEYYLVRLAGKRLNIVGELTDDRPIPAADFKTILGGDTVTGRNPTQRPVDFKNSAAHIFMSNYMINTKDHGEAFFARWKCVEFPNSRLVTGQPLDPMLAERIVATEMPAIMAWALEGGRQVLRNNGYSPSTVHDRLMAAWRRSTNSVEEFIHEACERGEGFRVRRASFYQAYKAWCSENGRRAFSKSRVLDLLKHNVPLRITHATLDGIELFRGVKVRDEFEAARTYF